MCLQGWQRMTKTGNEYAVQIFRTHAVICASACGATGSTAIAIALFFWGCLELRVIFDIVILQVVSSHRSITSHPRPSLSSTTLQMESLGDWIGKGLLRFDYVIRLADRPSSSDHLYRTVPSQRQQTHRNQVPRFHHLATWNEHTDVLRQRWRVGSNSDID